MPCPILDTKLPPPTEVGDIVISLYDMFTKLKQTGKFFMEKDREKLGKNIFIAGDNGYLAGYIAACIRKEGWQAIDYDTETMRLNNPYAVVFVSDGYEDAALLQVMTDAAKFNAQRFLYISRGLPVQVCYEDFALCWAKGHGISVSIIHIPEIAGPGQPEDQGCLGAFLSALRLGGRFVFAGDDSRKVSVLHVKDAAFGIFSVLKNEISASRIVLEGEEKFSFTQIVLLANGFARLPHIEIVPKGTDFYVPENWLGLQEDAVYRYRIFQKYPVAAALREIYESARAESADREDAQEKEDRSGFSGNFRPYLENIGLFAVVLAISYLQGKTPVNEATGLDISYLYIIIMGIMYGKAQSMPAIAASMLLLTWSFLSHHGEIASILYLPENIFHYTTYLFLAVFTGYVADSWKTREDSLLYRLQQMNSRYGFLQKNYQSAIAIKDKLYHQIINSDDSIGWLYSIVRQLDTVEVENIFTQAAVIAGKVMDTGNVAIYVVDRTQCYMRQKVRLGERTGRLPHSRRVEDTAYIRNMLESHHLFVNHGLKAGFPDLAAPIIYEGRIIAVIEIYDMDFEQWSIYRQNLLSVTARMISISMAKAYAYEEEIQSRKYFEGTRIMQESEFIRYQNGIKARAELQEGIKNLLLEIGQDNANYRDLDQRLAGSIRQEDAVGIMSGRVYILLENIDEYGLGLVKERLYARGIEIKDCRELV